MENYFKGKNIGNIRKIESEISHNEMKAFEGIALGIIKFNRVNSDDQLLLLKLLYQSMDKKEYKSGIEHEALAFIRSLLHHAPNLNFTPWAYRTNEDRKKDAIEKLEALGHSEDDYNFKLEKTTAIFTAKCESLTPKKIKIEV